MKKYLFALVSASAMFFAACDDDNSTAPIPDNPSSQAIEAQSSSSHDKGSSDSKNTPANWLIKSWLIQDFSFSSRKNSDKRVLFVILLAVIQLVDFKSTRIELLLILYLLSLSRP